MKVRILMKKFDLFNTFDLSFFVFTVLAGSLIYIFGSYTINFDLKVYRNKVDVYEKILNRQFNRTFESYEDYLLYRIEIGE